MAPKAAVAGLTFSGGGADRPLARLSDQDRELAVGWRGTLPRPVLAGDTATYPEVLPGVDLQVRAEAEGFSEVLVVKSREAARNPALAKIEFPTSSKGLTVRGTAERGLSAVDARGEVVFDSSPPADGTRLLRKEPGVTTLYLGGTELRLSGGQVQATRYYKHAGVTVAMRSADGLAWLFNDHQGTAPACSRWACASWRRPGRAGWPV